MNPNAGQLESILVAAVELPSEEQRRAFIDRACGGNEELKGQVEELLANHFRAGQFLEEPAPHLLSFLDSPDREQPGTVLGPYRLRELIGEGGFGVVFLAEQLHPVRREVAVKVLKPGMDTKQVIARFEAERQALALMDHPNIARIFDGGATPSGRPYFVMELVRGEPITEYCDRHHRNVHDRLALFVDVCQAVQHAHQKGILHRDLKPSNILVAAHEGGPLVKVIDFGIAKATRLPLTDKTLLTHAEQFLGTPAYVSPEQADRPGLDIDTRSDTYSLGVVLYELLTGTTPVDQDRLKTASYDELRRILREEEPARPSTRLSTLGTNAVIVSANRQSDPWRLVKSLRGELDWVVMKCLEKDRNRRYATASDLARDVERYLRDESVEACPPSAWYRATKFVRRHKAGVALAMVSVLCLALLGAGVGWILWAESARETRVNAGIDVALQEAKELHRESRWREAEAAAKRAEALLINGGSEELAHRVREVLADVRMGARLDEVRLLGSDVKEGRFDLEGAEQGYASAFRDFGVDVEALPCEEAAERLTARSIRGELAAALDDWARKRRARTGDASWRQLVEVASLVDPDHGRKTLRYAVLCGDTKALLAAAATTKIPPPGTLVLLAGYLSDVGHPLPAATLLRRAQEHYPGDFWINHQLAVSLIRLRPPRADEAIPYYTAAVAIRPTSPGARLNFGNALLDVGRVDAALTAYRKAIDLNPDYAEAHCNLSKALLTKGLLDDAHTACRKALELKPNLAHAHNALGDVLWKQNRRDAALRAYQCAITLNPRQAGFHYTLGLALLDADDLPGARQAFQNAVERQPHFAEAHNNLGLVLQRLGRRAEAVAAYREAVRLNPDLARAQHNLGRVLEADGDLNEAEATYQRVLRLTPDSVDARYDLGNLLLKQGLLEDAVLAYRRVVAEKPDYARAHCNLGYALRAQGQFLLALNAFQEGHKLGKSQPNWNYPSGRWVQECRRLVDLERHSTAILSGSKKPTSAGERNEFALFCYFTKHYLLAARLWVEAFAEDPKLIANLDDSPRYWAACAAALAAAGKGKGTDWLTTPERQQWWKQALTWLQADLSANRQVLKSGSPADRMRVAQRLSYWRSDPALAGLREPVDEKQWSADERRACARLWDEFHQVWRMAVETP